VGDPDAVAGMDADGAGDGFVVFERAVRGVEVFQGGDAVFFDKQGVSFADGGVGEDDVGRGQSSDRERCFPDRVAAAFFVFLVQDQDSHGVAPLICCVDSEYSIFAGFSSNATQKPAMRRCKATLARRSGGRGERRSGSSRKQWLTAANRNANPLSP